MKITGRITEERRVVAGALQTSHIVDLDVNMPDGEALPAAVDTWLRNNLRFCGHGYIHITCGDCQVRG